MKIAVDGRVFSVDQPGGDASVGIHLASEIAKQHNVRVFTHADLAEGTNNKLKNVSLEPVADYSSNMGYGLCWEQIFLPNAVREWNPEILFCPNSYCPLTRTDVKKVVSVQDIPSYNSYGNKKYRIFRKLILPIMVDRADRILTVSEFTKSEIVDYLGVDPNDVGVVYNGIDSVYFDNGVKPKKTLPEHFILFVGAKSERKNMRGVIKSFKILKQEYNFDQKLVLVGPDSNPTYDIIGGPEDSNGIEEDIINTGYLSDQELSYVYSQADIFVFPTFHQSFGLPPVEAMASGTPVITSRCGAIPEIVGDAAEFINPHSPQDIADGISRVLSDNNKYKQLIQRGTETANEYRWRNSAKQLLREFKKV